MNATIRLDDILGRRVRDADGRVVGRLFEIRAEEDGDDLVIVEYHVGANALLESIGIPLLRMLGLDARREPRKIPWDQLDLSDPDRPVIRAR